MFETMPAAPATENNADQARLEKRNEYIREALGAVLARRKAEVLKYHESPEVIVTMVQKELQAKIGLDKRVPADANRQQDFEEEFSRGAIRNELYRHFGVVEGDVESLSKAIKG